MAVLIQTVCSTIACYEILCLYVYICYVCLCVCVCMGMYLCVYVSRQVDPRVIVPLYVCFHITGSVWTIYCLATDNKRWSL